MKIYLLAALLGVFGLGIGASPAPRKHQKGDFLVGDNRCTWGPSYWCQNLTSAAGCQATQHCIQTVWEHQTYPTDHDDVCTICKDMVKQARDTLNSNETEEEIKEVFEGSCQLIHIKPIVKECIRIADEFAPQLIDALTSQMDPNTVCSVCGLCNNVAFDKMIAEAKKNEVKSPDLLHDEMMEDSLRQKCSNCVYVMDKVHSNLAATPEATFTKKLLTKCREMGSFSDSCSTLVVSHASSVYDFLLEKVKDEDACFLGGLCVGVKPYPLIRAVEVLPKAKLLTDGEQLEDDDLACDMCIALVDHFKQNLAANTTAIELKNVLLGICKNLRKFNTDCENLVESYYAKIYDYLKNGLVPKEVCLDVGICHNQVSSSTSGESEEINMQYIYANTKQPINPLIIGDILLPANLGLNTQQPEKKPSRPKIHSVPLEKDLTPGVLPVELYVPHADLATSQPLCTFCNYFLHFVQEEVTEPTNEKHIKDVIKSSCKRMPNQMYDECIQFVDQFGDTVVAMFVHQIDPSQICPSLHVCPTETNVEGKSCPLCLLAVKSIEDKLENNKTEENIKVTLENLCSHLPGDVRKECDTFIIEYFDDLIDMLVADFTPQEICTYLKLCNPPKLPGGDIATNEIYDGGDFQIFKEPSLKKDKPVGDEYCFFCTLIIDAIEKAAHDRNTDEQIKEDMMKVCKTLPGHMGKECSDFIRKYGDLIIDALINFTPKEVCQKIAVCVQAGIMNPSIYYMNQMVPDEKDDCKLCKKISVELKKLIEDTEEPMSIDEALKSVCAKLPFNVASHIQVPAESFFSQLPEDGRKMCDTFIFAHSDYLTDLFAAKLTPQEICIFLEYCDRPKIPDANTVTNNFYDESNFKIFKEPLLKDVRPLADIGEGCFFCTTIMNGISQSTADRKNEEEVKGVMFKVCENLPDQSSNTCLDWLRRYVDIIFDALSENLLKDVCEKVNICTLPGVMMSPDSHLNSMMRGVDDCTMCQEITSEIKKMVEHAQGSISVDDALRSVCARLPLAAASQVSAVGVLPRRKLLSAGEEFEEGNIACDMCVTLTEHFREVVPLDTTVLDYKKGLLNICKHVRSFNEDCANLVEPNYEKIFEDLKNGMSPKEVCVDVKICHGTAAPNAQLPVSNMLTQDEDYHVDENMHPLKLSLACMGFVSDKGQGINSGIAHNLTVQELCLSIGSCSSEDVQLERDVPTELQNVELLELNSSSSVFDGNSPTTAEQFDQSECKMCLYVLNNLKEQIPNAKGHTKPAHIKSSLAGLCNFLRKPESKKLCTNYVTGAGENVIDVLATINPQQLCVLFLVCPDSSASPSQSAQSAPQALSAAENHVSDMEKSHLFSGLLKNAGSDDDEDVDGETKKKNKVVPMPVLETDDCTICVNMAMIVYQLVNDDIPLELDQALQRACSVIHPLYYPRCLELLPKYREQLRTKILLFPRLFPTEYCKEFEPPVCAPSPIYGLGASNFHPYHHFKPATVARSAVLKEKYKDKESDLCELCQHTMFHIGPVMSNPNVTFKQVYDGITDSCNSFSGNKHQQCINMVDEYRYYMEAKLFSKPRTPFYQVCYQMADPLCSAKYTNPALRSKLMDAFLSEFPKGFVGNEQAFNFASEISDFASMIMYFMNTDTLNLNMTDASESSTASTTDSITVSTTDDYDDDDDDISTTTQREDKDDGTLCEICNEVIRKVKPYIQFLHLRKFLKAEIENSCYDIQPLHFQKCIKFVANYSSVLQETALYEMSTRTEDICTLTVPQFCRTSKADNPIINSKKWHSVTDLRGIDKIDEISKKDSSEEDEKDGKVDPYKEAFVPYAPILKSSEIIPNFVPKSAVPVSDCVICHKIVENIEPQIQGSKNTEEVKDRIMRACFSVEPEYFSQCLEFLPKYGPYLRDSIVADSTVPPSQICLNTKTLSCAPVKPEAPIPPVVPLSKQVPVGVELPEKKLHPLGSGSLMREIALKVCEKVIEKLLSGMEEVCTTFINKHFPEEENYYGGSTDFIRGNIKDCDICQEMLTVVTMVKTYQTGWRFDVHDSLYGSCLFLPTTHRWMCKSVLRKYGDEMVPYLETHSKDYMSVCDNLYPGPCHSARLEPMNDDDNSSDSDDNNNDNDENVRSSLRRQFVNQVLTQRRLVQQKLLSIDEKHEDTSNDFDDGSELKPFKEPLLKEVRPLPDSGEGCFFCTLITNGIEQSTVNRRVDEEVKEVMFKVCENLPETSSKTCSDWLRKYGDLIVDTLGDYALKEVCARVNVCTRPGVMMASNLLKNSIRIGIDDCTMCQEISSEVKRMVEHAQGTISIDDALGSVCDRLATTSHMLTQGGDYHANKNVHPLKLSLACMAFVSDKGQDINEGIACDFTVQELCFFTGSCPLGDVKLKRDVPIELQNVELPQDSSASSNSNDDSPTTGEQFDVGECKMCLFVLNNLKEQIPNAKGQSSPAEIRSSLTGICTYLRKPESKKICTEYVTSTGDNVIDVLAGINPQQLCVHFLACPASSVFPSQPAQPVPEVPKAFAAAENHVSGKTEKHSFFGLLKNDGSNDDEDDDGATNKKKALLVPSMLPLSDEDKEPLLCELCQHAMFCVGPLMSNPKVTFTQVYNAITDSCNNFTGDKHHQCVNMILEHRYSMEVELFGKPRTPFYQVCYQMTKPLCSAKYTNPTLRNKLMDAFLSEFPKGFVGNEQAFNFASEISDFASMIMYFMNTDTLNLNLTDASESSTVSTIESITVSTTDDYDDDDFTTTTQPEDKYDETLCEICNEVIRIVKPYIQFPTLRKFLKAEIEKSCYGILQPVHFSKCIKFVANYSSVLQETALYEIITNTEEICTLTVPQFCPVNEAGNPIIGNENRHSITDLRDTDKIEEFREKNSSEDDKKDDKVDPNKEAIVPYVPLILKDGEIIPDFVPKSAVPVSDCVICNKIAKNIEPQIQGSKNTEEIKGRIMKACFFIEPEYFSQCLEFLPKYGPYLRDSIIADSTVSPNQICLNTKTLSCAPVKPEAPIPPVVPLPKQVPVDVKLPEKKLHRLGSGSLMREIALKVCEKIIEKLLSGMEEVCATFINKHFPEEENYYGGALNSLTGVEDCDVCEEMMTVVSTVESDPTGTQLSLHETLYGSCGILPGAHRWVCEGVLRKYGDKIEPYLESHSKDYVSVCSDLQPGPCRAHSQDIHDDHSKDDDDNNNNDGANDNNDDEIARSSLRRQFVNQVLMQHRLVQRLSLSLDERHEDTSPDCVLCKEMVKEVRKQLILDHSKPIKDATESVCQFLPEVARHNCSEIVLASGTKIEEGLRWFVYDSPNYVCEQSELCDPYNTDADTKDPCKEGPDFWCLSFQNADQCDQIEYCQAKFRQDDD